MIRITATFRTLLTAGFVSAAMAAFAPAAFADCVNPTGTEGLLIYNSTSKVVQFCDGTNWIGMGGGGSGGGSSTMVGLSDVDAASAGDGDILQYSTSSSKWEAVPLPAGVAGTDTQVQFNDGGTTLAGAAQMLWNKTDNRLTVGTTTPGSYTVDVTGKTATTSLILKSVTGGAAPDVSGAAGGSANQVQFNSGGSLAGDSTFIWDNVNKRLGIGTVAPVTDAMLTLSSPTTESYLMFIRSNTGIYDAAVGIDAGHFVIRGGADATSVAGLNELMRVTALGNVGIGTTSPEQKLHVDGGYFHSSGAAAGYKGITMKNTDNNKQWQMLMRASSEGANQDKLMFHHYNGSAWSVPLTIDTGGNVGIGTATPGYKLDVNGTARIGNSGANIYGAIYGDASGTGGLSIEAANADNSAKKNIFLTAYGGNVGIGTTTPAQKLSVVGGIFISGIANSAADTFICWNSTSGILSWSSTSCNPSDERLKKNIKPIQNALSSIVKLQAVTFDWKEPRAHKGQEIGLIAQDVEKIFPQVVAKDSNGYLSLSYEKLAAPLIEAVKELKAENDALRARVEALEAKQ